MFLSRGDRDLGVAFQTHPGRQAFLSSGSKEPRSALESRRVSLGAHWGDYRRTHLVALIDSVSDKIVAKGVLTKDELKEHRDALLRHLGDAKTTVIDKL